MQTMRQIHTCFERGNIRTEFLQCFDAFLGRCDIVFLKLEDINSPEPRGSRRLDVEVHPKSGAQRPGNENGQCSESDYNTSQVQLRS